ncbi:hypothetical protein SAMN02745243_02942 [Hespellia stercorisuis DSM 15480]|uniref:Resolvase, N terminal domain n=1 Tax=Hespellia stercorisuis DSM 15480 TaxID=1121950 RepID=A0A1M6SGD1_9FIRM|nr:hypothetical protein SAMN02745243_02942 [Hespellia stercorisuis DSM 15480]
MAAKNIMAIPARKQVGNNVHTEEKPKLRVAAYCRVSTNSDAIADEIYRLRELKQQPEVEGVQRDEQINRIAELHDFIKAQPTELTAFDETLVRRMIEKIAVYDDFFTITFKSGISVDIKASDSACFGSTPISIRYWVKKQCRS